MDDQGPWCAVFGRSPETHAPHGALLPVSADLDSIFGQIAHHPAAAAAGILQVESIDPGHDPQCRFPTGLGRQYSVNRARPSRAHCRLPLSSDWLCSTGFRSSRESEEPRPFIEVLQLHLEPADPLE